MIAKDLIDAALANYCIQHFIADPALPYPQKCSKREVDAYLANVL